MRLLQNLEFIHGNHHACNAYVFTVFDFNLHPLQQAIEAAPLSWAFRENCLSVRAFQRGRVFSRHGNGAVSMGTLFFRAQLLWRPFLGTLLGCSKKSTSLAGRDPQCQSKQKSKMLNNETQKKHHHKR